MACALLLPSLVRATMRAAAAIATVLWGCSADNEVERSHDHVGRAIQPIISGVPSGAEHDAVVVLATFRDGARQGLCTATLVAPNLVLTARHCVSDVDGQASCYSDGTAIVGAGVHDDRDPHELVVFAPKDGVVATTTDEALASARGKALVVDDLATTICNRDLAFVVLDRAVSAPVARIRLGAPKPAEDVTVVGFGITETGALPGTRMERASVPLLGAGPMLYPDDQRYGFGDAEFMVGESACLGDSGGPALAPSGAVVGVASRAGNGKARDPDDLSSTCTGETAHAIYTHLAQATDLVARAFLEAGVMPRLEEPAKRAADGDSPVLTHVTGADGARAARAPHRASRPATPAAATAALGGAASDEAASPAEEAGCSASPQAPAGAPSAGLALAMLALAVAERRRARRSVDPGRAPVRE